MEGGSRPPQPLVLTVELLFDLLKLGTLTNAQYGSKIRASSFRRRGVEVVVMVVVLVVLVLVLVLPLLLLLTTTTTTTTTASLP